MTLYRKYIKPLKCYPALDYSPKTEPLEVPETWYPEEERENLEQKYSYVNDGSFINLIFDEKYEPYAVEPEFKKLKVPEKCKDCKSCYASMTGAPYCHMETIFAKDPQIDISSVYVDIESRPDWCPIIKTNMELEEMPVEKRGKFDKIMTGLSSLFGGDDLWD